ncbi:MAG: hypothetical protein ABSH51_31200, partial [Solirubrobacteraceae bacterium]
REETPTVAEENFKAAFGHYPIHVVLPEPTPDPQLDALVARWLRHGQPPALRAISAGQSPMSPSACAMCVEQAEEVRVVGWDHSNVRDAQECPECGRPWDDTTLEQVRQDAGIA